MYPIGRVFSVGSSSLGNAFYVEINRKDYPQPFRLLIECGFSFDRIQKKLLDKGIGINELDACLVTHEHLDHAKSVPELVKRGKKVYAPQSVFDKFGIEPDRKYVIKEKVVHSIADGIKVLGFPLDHENEDGSKTYNLGYIITVNDDFRILFITDTKYIRWDLSEYQFNMIFIEANYQRKTIYFAMKDAEKKNNHWLAKHYKRVLNSHFCVDNTAQTLSEFDLSKTDIIYLIHLSANTIINPFDFKETIKKAIRNQMRKVSHKNRIINMPKIKVVKRNGEIV